MAKMANMPKILSPDDSYLQSQQENNLLLFQ